MFRFSVLATGSMVLLISACSTNYGIERSAALYVAQNEITANCDRNATCVDKWDVAQDLLRQNSLAKKEGRDIFFGNNANTSDNLEASWIKDVRDSFDDESSDKR